jgi:hypothetical protein
VPAEAIYWAAHHDRHELWLGWSAVKAVMGNKVIPRELDYYLAWTGVDSQQTGEPVSQDRKDNLFEPVDDAEDRGAHGTFDERSRPKSYQWVASTHRGWLAATAVGLTAAAYAALRR